jgi:hypothetical protein
MFCFPFPQRILSVLQAKTPRSATTAEPGNQTSGCHFGPLVMLSRGFDGPALRRNPHSGHLFLMCIKRLTQSPSGDQSHRDDRRCCGRTVTRRSRDARMKADS